VPTQINRTFMQKSLVIVESPAKAKTIEKFLGKGFHVKSSYGHIRDLSKKDLGIDLANDFAPQYEISPDKRKLVSELKQLVGEFDTIYLASDEDREGEAIAWHLFETLGLKEENTLRIVFHEITKEAILTAIKNPRSIDINLVNAQQARRVLDRLVGFELSPVLWKKVKPSLSAGRVQSVAVRLVVEREREINSFNSQFAYRVNGVFKNLTTENNAEFGAELEHRFDTLKEAQDFLKLCSGAGYTVADVVKKPAKRSPSQPFTTSTLQQEAAHKHGFSVSQTMSIAQKLYEAGHITYMRTDSVNLSDLALNALQKTIVADFGEKYHTMRQYKTKTQGAQEAHEAIRPTYIDKRTIDGNPAEQKLYELIWKRTLASQMANAEFEKTTATIDVSTTPYKFVATGEVLKFDGFLRVYTETTEEETENPKMLPPLHKADQLEYIKIVAKQKFTISPARYTEASLVKKLEELGIGRPSTYAPTISTVQQRGYVIKDTREGTKREFDYIELDQKGKIKHQVLSEIVGNEKNKLFPTDIGIVVNDFLVEYFQDVMNFKFTANIEKKFDEIAAGKTIWQKMIGVFYSPFHELISKAMEVSKQKVSDRPLGNDPQTGKPLFAKIGRYGPMIQLGDAHENVEEKPSFASLLPGQHIDTITLEQALQLFQLPRALGEYKGTKVEASTGRFGPYVKFGSVFVSMKKGVDDPLSINLERAIELIEEKILSDSMKLITQFPEEPSMKVLNGRWGPYISFNKNNYKIPKSVEAKDITLAQCRQIIEEADKKSPKTAKKATKTFKKTTKK